MNRKGAQIVIVDDDDTLVETLEYNLKRHGFATVSLKTGRDALASIDGINPDLIILDWMLPDMSGPEILKILRARNCTTPVLMLTGRSRPADVAVGLGSGADDYLVKPFSTIELMARIQALMRRAGSIPGSVPLEVGNLKLDAEARKVSLGQKEIELSPKEFLLLRILMEHPGTTFSTESLLSRVWGADYIGDTKTVAVHIRWLRKKLEDDPNNPQILETIHKAGYRLNPAGASKNVQTVEERSRC